MTDHDTTSRPKCGRRCARVVVALAVCLLGTVLVAAHPATAQESVTGDVRVAARSVGGDRVEFAVQQRDGDGWGQRVLPSSRFFPLVTTVGRWLVSTPVNVEGATVRVTAARTDTGRVEFAIQHQTASTWTQRLLPTSRYFPISTELGRWLVSSPVALTAPPSGIDQEQACRDIIPDIGLAGQDFSAGAEFFCAGANDAPNVIRFFVCTVAGRTPGFDVVWSAPGLLQTSVSPPVTIQVGTRIEWHPNPDCATHTKSTAVVIVDPYHSPTHIRACRVSFSYTRDTLHGTKSHKQGWIQRLSDGTVRLSGFTGIVGHGNPCRR